MRGRLARGVAITPERYRECLALREGIKARLADLASVVDGLVTLSQPGIAPVGLESTGDAVFNAPASMAGGPAITLPLMAVDGMPLGFQVMGFAHDDANAAAHARWILESFSSVPLARRRLAGATGVSPVYLAGSSPGSRRRSR